MAKLDSPFQLSPVYKQKIWGRKELAPWFARPKRLAGIDDKALIGEVWITDDEARFLNGPLTGLTLAEASRQCGPELNGTSWNDPRFPILAKYIFTSDWLSVQVHPDDDYARVHEPGNRGKCEMWYFLQPERGAEILLAFNEAHDKQHLRKAFEEGGAKDLLHRFHPRPGESSYLPPGTVHALGPGLVLFEAEENSDLTYRLDDFGRVGLDGKPRPLHWDKGIDVIDTKLPAYHDLPRVEIKESFGWRRFVLACRFFAVEELNISRLASFAGRRERVELFSVLGGEGRVETAQGWFAYRAGETWLVPPATGQYRWVPRRKTRLLKIYVPDLNRDFRRPLAIQKVRAEETRKLVFD